jgi:hypothetical protein
MLKQIRHDPDAAVIRQLSQKISKWQAPIAFTNIIVLFCSILI